ncbi:hypothetical protein [Streptomyces atacamensis]|uniref:hypothetical protein n=1 Tax=Streptomyces atacamensis TaxID=531966 RepID=UPI00399C77E5
MIGTRRLLVAQLVSLVVLALLAAAVLFAAYDDTHRRPAAVRDRTAPAVLEVAAARGALVDAHLAARDHLASELVDGTSTDETYRTYMAAATQSLSQIADRQVAGEEGKRELSTVIALLMVYQEAVARAIEHAEDEALSEAWSASADTIINRGGTGILSRLDGLQRDQLRRLREQTEFTDARRELWRAAVAAPLVPLLALAVAQWQLQRRFPQRLNPFLLLACAVLLASWLPVRWAQDTQNGLDEARRELVAVAGPQQGTKARGEAPRGEPEETRAAVTGARTGVEEVLDATSGSERRAVLIPLGGAAVALLSWAGLQRHLSQYRFRS